MSGLISKLYDFSYILLFRKFNQKHYERTTRYLEFCLELQADLDEEHMDAASTTLGAFSTGLKQHQENIQIADSKFFTDWFEIPHLILFLLLVYLLQYAHDLQ